MTEYQIKMKKETIIFKSKILKIESLYAPVVLRNGSTLHKYKVTFEDGTIGTTLLSVTSPDLRIKPEEYNYTVKNKIYKGKEYTNIRLVKPSWMPLRAINWRAVMRGERNINNDSLTQIETQ